MKFQFGLRTFALAVFVCAILVVGAKRFYDSLPGPLIPFGTDGELAAAVRDAFENPPNEYEAIRPGWATVEQTSEMKRVAAFGDEAIPVLVANLLNRNQVMRLQVYEMLAMLDAESAVPDLVSALRYDDGGDDAFIVAKLAEITKHPDGHRFYRFWFQDAIQREASEAYRTWYAECQITTKKEPEP